MSESYVQKVADYMVSSGLAAKGYKYCNVDEGWMLGRNDTTLHPIADPKAFPGGMKALGDYIHKKGLLYGLYTSRGDTQCARPEYQKRCIHTPPNPKQGCEGSHGYETIDGTWLVNQGADYIKEVSVQTVAMVGRSNIEPMIHTALGQIQPPGLVWWLAGPCNSL